MLTNCIFLWRYILISGVEEGYLSSTGPVPCAWLTLGLLLKYYHVSCCIWSCLDIIIVGCHHYDLSKGLRINVQQLLDIINCRQMMSLFPEWLACTSSGWMTFQYSKQKKCIPCGQNVHGNIIIRFPCSYILYPKRVQLVDTFLTFTLCSWWQLCGVHYWYEAQVVQTQVWHPPW